jgi:hypothetical protein
MTGQTVTKGTAPHFTPTVDSTTNRIFGFAFDANGNLVNDGTRTYEYDVENRLTKNALGQPLLYGADNRRVFDGARMCSGR